MVCSGDTLCPRGVVSWLRFALDDQALEEYNMLTEKKCVVALVVERVCQPWGVREPEGSLLPAACRRRPRASANRST